MLIQKVAAENFNPPRSLCSSGGLMTQLDSRGTGSHSRLKMTWEIRLSRDGIFYVGEERKGV